MKVIQSLMVGILALGLVSVSSASPCAPHSNGQNIHISGVLKGEVNWGPPNFGENPKTDTKFTAWILHLDSPIVVVRDEGDGDNGDVSVSEIQLELSNTFSNDQIAALVNKHISVEGGLWEARTPGDVTDFNVSVSKAAKTGTKEGLSCVGNQK